MNRAVIIAICTVAALSILSGGAHWFAAIVRKADQAAIANQTVKEIQQMEKNDAKFKNLDMAHICAELELDFVSERNECE